VAVRSGPRIASAWLPADQHQARSLLGAVTALLDGLRVGIGDLDGVAVTRGPGSFTGIRIGLATAQGLAASRGWCVWVCDSLVVEAAAVAAELGPRTCAVVQDARRGEVYAAAYRCRGPTPEPIVAPFCANPVTAAAHLAAATSAASPSEVGLLGSGAALVESELGKRVPVRVLASAPRARVAESLLALAEAGACERITPERLTPLYLRASDAEETRQRSERNLERDAER
jgi:tRNA threonylcarbamoyladenosine biosynthesis protein TsaB